MTPTQTTVRRLSKVKADDIRRLYANGSGDSISQLAEKFNVHTQTIINVVTGKHWHLQRTPNQTIPLMPSDKAQPVQVDSKPASLQVLEVAARDSEEVARVLHKQLTEQAAKITKDGETINTLRRVVANQAIEIQQLREKLNYEHRNYA